jgi:glycosyltransferase involved in cell wall biosynthesis
MLNLAFVTSHPIQYQVPVFRHLADRTDMNLTVLFAMLPDSRAQGAGFGVEFEWDVPILEGYDYEVLSNVSRNPNVTTFRGCDTPGIASVLKQRRIDAVVVNGWVVKTCLQALKACRQLKIPCIVRGEANNLRPRPWWKRCLQRQLVRRYDAFLPIGTANREFYRSYGIHDEVMFDAPYCVENDRFAKAAEVSAVRREEIRHTWNVPLDSTCLLYCGKFEEKKHPLELLSALDIAKKDGAKLHLLMVGDGVLRQDCEELARERGLPVTFTGFLNQSMIVDAYVAADVLVLPSDHGETWGLVTNEAMACGLPAIVSDQVGCATDLIDSGNTGWIFPFGDWATLSSILSNVAADRLRLHDMESKCRQRIASFTPLDAANGIAQAVHSVNRNIRR